MPLNAGGVRAVAGNGVVSVSWNAPVSNGGAAILRYLVQRSTSPAGGWTTATSTSGRAALVAGLRNDVRYYFRVIAVNAIGNSAPSWWAAAVPSTAASTLPTSPRAVFSTVGDRRMTVAWTAPVSGRSPVLAYRVQIATHATGPWVTVRWTSASVHGVIFTGLHNGTRYYARVIAVNRYGAGRPSAATSNMPVPPRPPGAPGGLRASIGDGRITVAWNTPTNNGGAAVRTYRVQLATGVGGSWVTLKWIPASTHGVVLSGLRNGTRYYARVIAVNSGGPGAPSAPISATPQVVRSASARVPGAPAGLRTSVGDGRVTVAWNAPTSNGGSAILTYRVQLASSASGPWMNSQFVPASTHGVSITGLKNGTRYWARVIAVNAIGAGAPSAGISAVPVGASTLRPPTSTGTCTTAGNVPGAGDPFGGCWPGPANTGPDRGEAQMTAYTGPCTITVANTVIDSKVIRCDIQVRAAGLVIRNSYIYGAVIGPDSTSGPAFRIEDSLIDGAMANGFACINCGVGGSNWTVLRTEIINTNRGAYCQATCTLQDSYIHGTNLDPSPSNLAHASAVRVEQYTRVIHNTLSCDYTGPFNNDEIGCSADMSGYADFAAIHNNTINGNLFMSNTIGSGFCAYGGNTAGKPSSDDPSNGTYIVFSNNVFQKGSNGRCGAYGPITDFDTAGTGNAWFNNLWYDGAAVAPG